MKHFIAIPALALLGISACKKAPSGNNAPSISFVSMKPNTVISGSSKDTVFIQFNVSDKDGDLGNDAGSGNYDIYIKDSRDNAPAQGLPFPTIPADISENKEGISGVCTIRMYASLFLIARSDPQHKNEDTLTYEIYVKDKAQHESNRIKTPNIYIQVP